MSALGMPPPLTMPLRMLARMAYWLGFIMPGRIMVWEFSRMRCTFWKIVRIDPRIRYASCLPARALDTAELVRRYLYARPPERCP